MYPLRGNTWYHFMPVAAHFSIIHSLSFKLHSKNKTKWNFWSYVVTKRVLFLFFLQTSVVSWNYARVKEGRLHVVRQGILFFWAESCRFISSLSAKCAEWCRSVCCVALCGAYICQMLHPCTFCSFIILSGQMFCNSYNHTACTLSNLMLFGPCIIV